MQREPFELGIFMKNFRTPAVRQRGDFDLSQDGADVNRLAVVAAVIFAELLHAENFTQRCGDAKEIVQLAFFWQRMIIPI